MKNYSFPEKKRNKPSRFSRIIASAVYLPEKRVSNKEIIQKGKLPFKETIIEKNIGVKERRVAEENTSDSDLLTAAGKKCLAKAHIDVNRLSRLIVTKFIGDNQFPMTASMVQRKLGANVAFQAFDMEGGTSSFIHALDLADKYISTGEEYILIVSGGITNKFINARDARTAFLFGDGAAAILIGRAEEEHFIDSYFYTNYDFYDFCRSHETTELAGELIDNNRKDLLFDCYTMGNWQDVIGFFETATDKIVEKLLTENGLTLEHVDYFLITETNKSIRDRILKKLGCPETRSVTLLAKQGNTMSAMLPMLYNHLEEKNLLTEESTILFLSHGEGVSGGGILYKTKGLNSDEKKIKDYGKGGEV